MKLPKKESSYWLDKYQRTMFPKLQKDIKTDVAIIGGGITGLTVAYLMKRLGLRVIVVEKNLIGSGTTGGTTGKVTAQHGIMYQNLVRRLGKRKARLYAQANSEAVEEIESVIKREGISCGWEREDNFVFTTQAKSVSHFKAEARTAAELGLPARFVTDVPLPFEVKGVVKFTRQAKIHSLEYVHGLAALVDGDGSHVFEHSNITHIRDGHPQRIGTADATVTATDIIVATKVPAAPLVARLAYALQEYPTTSYIVAGRFDGSLKGMYISPDPDHYSILPVSLGKERLLLIGGGGHLPGLGSASKRYRELAAYAQKYFGITSFAYKWKAMDYIAYDHVPLIGKVYPWSEHMYTATGFQKWGLSTSMVAAQLLRDAVLGQSNQVALVFDTMRLSAANRFK